MSAHVEAGGRGAGQQLQMRDGVVAFLLFVVAVAMRVPFRSRLVYHWDSAQFVLAIRQFDIRLSQPHAPGYFLYVLLGRLVNNWIGDPHASLVWISIVFGSALSAVLYLLGTVMAGRRAGAAAAVMGLTSPQVWFHSCVALTYVVDSFLVCAIVLELWLAVQRGGTWWDAVAIGALLALLGGVRQQSVPELVPLVAFAFWQFQRARLAKLAVAAVTAVGLGLAWFVPMLRVSGGWGAYLTIVRRHAFVNASSTLWGGGWDALLQNVANTTGYCLNGLMLAAVIWIAALLYRAARMTTEQKRLWNSQHALALAVLAAWVVPMVIFGTVIGFTKQPGYVLGYLPALFLLTAIVIATLKNARYRSLLIVAIGAVNVISFLAWPALWDRVFFGMARTSAEIARHDSQLSGIVADVRQRFSPKDVVICFSEEYYLWGLRHFQVCLPEYEQYQLVLDSTALHPPGKPIWRVRDGRLGFVDKPDLQNKTGVVLFVPPGESVEIFAPYLSLASMRAVSRITGNLYLLPAQDMKPSG
ncbi:MAG TPA: glycosyltransferase family 39 protein [Verrucomicrobiae bacterium]|nr:glycosyltransferase family 39 protein [Verrucomicrobiae bacterium]